MSRKHLKPRDKVTQRMTRDGVVLENQTTGEEINISDREAEQDFTPAGATGRAEKVLERAVGLVKGRMTFSKIRSPAPGSELSMYF